MDIEESMGDCEEMVMKIERQSDAEEEDAASTEEIRNEDAEGTTNSTSRDNDSNVFQCHVCGKQYPDKSRLNIHAKTHRRNHKCPHCEMAFCALSSFRIHLQKHGDQYKLPLNFTCEICGSSFRSNLSLTKHSRLHDGLKPFFCALCSASFTDRGGLLAHERRHTGETPYTCTICGKSYSRRSTLNYHKKIHKGERKWQCSFCDRNFTKQSHLKGHILSHTKEKPYECDICHKRFSRLTYLKVHYRRVHDVVMPLKFPLVGKTPGRVPGMSADAGVSDSDSDTLEELLDFP